MSRRRWIVTAMFVGSAFAGVGFAQSPLGAAPLPLPSPVPSVPAAVPDVLTYQIHTIYAPVGGDPIERTTPAVLALPLPVDVDGDLTTGVAGSEFLAQLTIDAGRASFRVTKLPDTPAAMPLLIEAILADPRGGSSLRVAFGYDARAAKAPDVYTATIHLLGASRVTSFSLDVETAGAGNTLGVIAAVFTQGPNDERLDPQRGRVDFTPVPTITHVGLLQGQDLGTQQSGLDITTNVPTTVVVVIEDLQGAHETRGDITIDRVPQVVSLVLTDAPDGQRTWNYQASDQIALIDLTIRETQGSAVVDDFALHIERMALTAVIVQDTATHATMQADRAIGVVQVGTATGRDVAWLDEPAYVYSTDHGGDSLAFRVLGLQRAELDSADPFLIDVTIQAGPFHVLIEDASTTIDARIDDLPSQIRLTFSPTQGTADWTTSDPIDLIDISATDPSGLAGRATRLHITLEDIPTGISVAWGEASGHAKLQASNGSIGRVSLLLTSGPDLAVDPGFDGVVLEDVPDHYAIAALLNGLRLVDVSTGAAPYTADLRKAAGPFLIRLDRGTQHARIEVLDLPDSLQATFDPAGSLSYTGSAGIGSITADVSDPAGVAGRATQLALRIADIPPALTLTYVSGSTAGVDAHGGRIGSIDLTLTSGPAIAVDTGFDGVVFEDVPDHYAAAVHLTGLRSISVGTGGAPYTLDLSKDAGPFLLRLVQGARTTHVEAHDLPATMHASLDPAGSLSYTGSAPIASLDADITDPAGVAGRATHATATLRAIPSTLSLSWNSTNGAITADAGSGSVGLLEVLLTSGPVETLPADRDGVILHDLADRYVVFARITGLKKVTFTQGPPPSFSLATGGGRLFVVDVQHAKPSGIAVTSATINVLPATVAVQFTSATTFSYLASSGVASIQLDATDPDGISGRATAMHASILSAPQAFDVVWSSGGTITLDAKGGTVGLLEIQLTSGPDDRLDPSVDGLLLEDLPDRYVVFARMTGLQKVVGTQQPAPDITLNSTGGRVLRIDLEQWDGSKVAYTRATLDRLPSSVHVQLAGKRIFYDATAATNSLVLDTNSGDRWNLHADVRAPLPSHLAFCSAGDGYCDGYARSSGAGSFTFDASEHTTVNVFDCVRPLNSGCVQGNADTYVQVSDWRVRHFDFDADASSSGESGYTFNNTNGYETHGYLKQIDGSSGFEADIHPGYASSNRRVDWSLWGLFKDKSGSVNCAGSGFSIRVIGIWLGITSYVC